MLRVLRFLQQTRRLCPKLLRMAASEEVKPDLSGKKREAESIADDASSTSKKKKKKHVVSLGQNEGFKRKIAMLVAYNGAGYYGVQVNPGYPTIESDFFPALVKVGAIPEDHVTTLSKMWFQRGSRTDKGVSAVGQIFSMKAVIVPDFVQKLNENLPDAIRVLGYVRTTNGFDSKNFCCARTYMYMLPTFAFAPIEKFVTDDYRVSPETIEQVRSTLAIFQGTHKFHNFTSGVKFEQACASRYIIKFECSDPFVREGMEFVTMRVKGQSFMLHHIRKMIGLTIAIVRGFCSQSVIETCWGPERVDVPKAPGLGLVLEQLHFDGYNKKFGSDGVHDPIDWSQYQETVDKFKEEHIISKIVDTEKKERVTFEWMRTLQFHNFDTQREEGPQKPWIPVKRWLDGKLENHPSEVDVTPKDSNGASETHEDRVISSDPAEVKDSSLTQQPCDAQHSSPGKDESSQSANLADTVSPEDQRGSTTEAAQESIK